LRDLAGFNFNTSQEVGEGNPDPTGSPGTPPGSGGFGGGGGGTTGGSNFGIQETIRQALNRSFNKFGDPRAGAVAKRDRGGPFFPTGQVGLGAGAIAGQLALSNEFPDLVLFDLEGNVSVFGGVLQ